MKAFLLKRPYVLFLMPAVILYTLFVVYPIFSAANISLYSWNGYGAKTFVGLQNYRELFTSGSMIKQMTNALGNSLLLFVLTVVAAIPIQIVMAYMIYTKAKGKNYFQVAIFSPQFISTPVIVFIFTMLFDANIGIFNKVLSLLGYKDLVRPWLGIPGIYVVWMMITWAGIGVGMMYFIGAMKMIPREMMESAYMDGAGFWRRLRHIVLPQIKATILNIVLISYIVALTIFDFSYILGGTHGGVDGNVDVMSLFFYRTAFGDSSPLGGKVSVNPMGMGTAIACVLFLIIFVVAAFQIVLMFRKREARE